MIEDALLLSRAAIRSPPGVLAIAVTAPTTLVRLRPVRVLKSPLRSAAAAVLASAVEAARRVVKVRIVKLIVMRRVVKGDVRRLKEGRERQGNG